MKVVIFCGGMGTRLKEETEFKPKPLVMIGGRPILWHIMKIYAYYGFHDFILCLGYKGEMIKDYFFHYEVMNSDFTIELGNQQNITLHRQNDEKGWKVTLVNTGDKTLKGARLKRIQKYVDSDTFMVTYGDGLANININKLLAFHKSHGRLATVTGINPTSRFGELKIKDTMVESFYEKSSKTCSLVNGGFLVFNKKVFDYISDDEGCDLEVGAMERLATEGQLMAYSHSGFWACMDNIRDMEYLNKLWDENNAAWKIW